MIDGSLPPSLGRPIAQWMERWLVHAEGDNLGEPVRLAWHQRYVLDRMFEYNPHTGRLLYDRVIVGMGKGNSKTEDAARIAVTEVAGPAAPVSPHVVVSAASWEQADKVFGAAATMIEKGPLADLFDVHEHEISPKRDPGIIERIAAVAGTNDGGLPTCHIGDELHEWLGERRSRVYTVQGKSLRKRRVPRPGGIEGGLQIGITTAGDDSDSLLGRLYAHGRRVASGEIDDPSFLFLWWEAGPEWNLDDPQHLEQAILEANPGVGSFLSMDGLLASFRDPTVDRHEFERYNLNRWVSSPKAWIPEAQLLARVRRPGQVSGPPPEGTPIVLGFDGSYNRDTAALVGWTLDDYGFVIEAWERDADDPYWTVPRIEVDAAVARAFGRWRVLELAADPWGWVSELEAWEREFGEAVYDPERDRVTGSGVVLRFESNQPSVMGPACDAFRVAVRDSSQLTLDGDPRMLRHMKNARTRESRYGDLIVKDRKDSPRKIDIAVACVIARTRARWHALKGRPRAARRGTFRSI